MHEQPAADLSRSRFDALFPDEAAAVRFFVEARWPDGPECPSCGSRAVGWLRTRPRFQCRVCRVQTSVRAGTPLHGSRKPLRDWLYLIWRAAQERWCNASMLQRELGYACYETAWRMLHKVRVALVHSHEPRLAGNYVVMGWARLGAPLPAGGRPGTRAPVQVAVAIADWRLSAKDPETRVVCAGTDVPWSPALEAAAAEAVTLAGTRVAWPPELGHGPHRGMRKRWNVHLQRCAVARGAEALTAWLAANYRRVSGRYLPNYVDHWRACEARPPLGELVRGIVREPRVPPRELAAPPGAVVTPPPLVPSAIRWISAARAAPRPAPPAPPARWPRPLPWSRIRS